MYETSVKFVHCMYRINGIAYLYGVLKCVKCTFFIALNLILLHNTILVNKVKVALHADDNPRVLIMCVSCSLKYYSRSSYPTPSHSPNDQIVTSHI